jgi:hypothetical protein
VGVAVDVNQVVARAGVVARWVAAPLRPIGIAALAAGVGVWLMLGLPVWDEGVDLATAIFLFVLLVVPGIWLLIHHRWLERAFQKAEQLIPDATTVGRGAVDALGSDEAKGLGKAGGRLRGAWSLYRRHLGPLRRQGTDLAGNTVSIVRPFVPSVLIATGIALALAILYVILVPLATLIRLILVTT